MIDNQLSKLGMGDRHLSSTLDASPTPPPREQERLKVDEPLAAPKPKPKKSKPARKK